MINGIEHSDNVREAIQPNGMKVIQLLQPSYIVVSDDNEVLDVDGRPLLTLEEVEKVLGRPVEW